MKITREILFRLLKKHSTDYIESEARGICVDDLDVDSFLDEAIIKLQAVEPRNESVKVCAICGNNKDVYFDAFLATLICENCRNGQT